MRFEFGKSVLTSDGERVGSVDRLVIDPTAGTLPEFIVHRGVLLREDRIVERQLVDHVEPDGTVKLNAPSRHMELLPRFAAHEYITPPSDEKRYGAYPLGHSRGPVPFMETGYSGSGYRINEKGVGETLPVETPVVEARSNLSPDTVVVEGGTDVLDRDGNHVGTIHGLSCNDEGEIDAFVVKPAFFTQERAQVTMAQIASMTHHAVRLSVPASELARDAHAAF